MAQEFIVTPIKNPGDEKTAAEANAENAVVNNNATDSETRLTDLENVNSETRITDLENGEIATGIALDGKVDDAQVLTDVPSGALFTDTVYDDTGLIQQIDDKLETVSTDTTLTGDGTVGDPLSVAPVVGVYGELYMSSTGSQKLKNVEETIEFNASGPSNGVTPNVGANSLTIIEDGDYSVRFDGSVVNKRDTIYDIAIQINGNTNVPIGCALTSDDNDAHGISMGRILPLLAGDVITIVGITDVSTDKDWKLREGFHFAIIKV